MKKGKKNIQRTLTCGYLRVYYYLKEQGATYDKAFPSRKDILAGG